MNIMKKLILFTCVIAVCTAFLACSNGVEETAALDKIMTEKINSESEAIVVASVAPEKTELVTDPITAAIEAGEQFFEGIYTADGLIWQFFPDGTVDTYSASGMIQRYTYSIIYSGGGNINKALVINKGDVESQYRFKKITDHGFDIVLVDSSGNDGNTTSFIVSSFYDALFNRKPFFNDTFHNSGTVWIFTDDGFLKAYDANGNAYNFLYNLEFVENNGITEKYLLIGENVGHEHEKITSMKIISFSAGKFSAIKIVDGKEASDTQTFTKQ